MSLEWETVRVDGDGPVRHLVLNRPEVHNAVNSQLIADVHAACLALDADPGVRVVIVRGEGQAACPRVPISSRSAAPASTRCWVPRRAPACTTR